MFHSKALKECANIREELDDHLEAINSNSRDVADVHETLSGLDEKLEKLSTRIDELYMLLGAEVQLTSKEAVLQAFLQAPRTMDEMAAFADETIAGVEHCLRMLLVKGVAVHKFEERGTQLFTTNLASRNQLPLNSYF